VYRTLAAAVCIALTNFSAARGDKSARVSMSLALKAARDCPCFGLFGGIPSLTPGLGDDVGASKLQIQSCRASQIPCGDQRPVEGGLLRPPEENPTGALFRPTPTTGTAPASPEKGYSAR
jgi:hypothetical protein